MIYLLGLIAVFLIIFTANKLQKYRDISVLFRSLSFFKIHYLLFGMLLVFFFPNNFMPLFERTRVPVIMFCLSWIGLYYGCGLELRIHQRFPVKVILFNIIEPLIVFSLVTVIGVLFLYFKYDSWSFTDIAVIIGIFSSFTIFRRHGILNREGDSSHHPVLDNLLPAGNIFPLILLCIAGGVLSETQSISIAGIAITGLFSKCIMNIFLGIAGGVLLNMLISGADGSDSKSIILIGVAAFCGGLAYAFSLSPLFVATISGAFLINATLKRLQTLQALNETNEIIERLFMFVLGTVLSPLILMFKKDVVFLVIFALVLFLLRSSLKYILSSLWISRIQGETSGSAIIWVGLTGQGILASAAAFECGLYAQIMPSILILIITLLVFNQLTIGFHMWYSEKSDKTKKS